MTQRERREIGVGYMTHRERREIGVGIIVTPRPEGSKLFRDTRPLKALVAT